ncbi:MAG: flagellar protein [Oscillospiraceae bacterium]|nr:flagellar protein [Oscillospiraceae bacterium]
MDARQCRRCRKLFQFTGNPICPNCVREMDQKFSEVRDYIYANPAASMDAVCEATDVEPGDIKRWLAEGRLLLNKGAAIGLSCEKCGKTILSGTQCEECLAKLRSTLQGAANTLKPPEPPKPKPQAVSKPKEKMHVTVRKI